MGGSDFQRGRSFLDWPNDVTELVDALGLERFAVLGVSGGGPYVIACAHSIPDRLRAAVIVAGVAPAPSPDATVGMSSQNRRVFSIARGAPWLARVIFELTAGAVRWFPQSVLPRLSAPAPPCDKAVLERPELQTAILASLRQAFRNGGRGVAYEMTLYARPWGFPLKDARHPIDLWQGTEDVNVPLSMGEELARQLPDCHAHFLEAEGHFSLLANHQQEILAALAE
jgi:pimeloyl-ACP methyl ester carboxylesterase